MKLVTDELEFEGELSDLIELALFSGFVWRALKCEKAYVKELGKGESYTLESYETWDDDDEKPN